MEYEIGPDETVHTAVVCAVSDVKGVDYRSLPPLGDVIDPDSIHELFGPRSNGTIRRGGRLSFVYSNCHVTVDNGEYLTVTPIEPGVSPARGSDAVDIEIR